MTRSKAKLAAFLTVLALALPTSALAGGRGGPARGQRASKSTSRSQAKRKAAAKQRAEAQRSRQQQLQHRGPLGTFLGKRAAAEAARSQAKATKHRDARPGKVQAPSPGLKVRGVKNAPKKATVKVNNLVQGEWAFTTKTAWQVHQILEAAALRETINPSLRTRVSQLVKRAVQRAPEAQFSTMQNIASGMSVADAIHSGQLSAKVETLPEKNGVGQHRITLTRGDQSVTIQTNYSKTEWRQFTRPGFGPWVD